MVRPPIGLKSAQRFSDKTLASPIIQETLPTIQPVLTRLQPRPSSTRTRIASIVAMSEVSPHFSPEIEKKAASYGIIRVLSASYTNI